MTTTMTTVICCRSCTSIVSFRRTLWIARPPLLLPGADQYTLPIYPTNITCHQHTLSTHPINTPYQPTLSIHPINNYYTLNTLKKISPLLHPHHQQHHHQAIARNIFPIKQVPFTPSIGRDFRCIMSDQNQSCPRLYPYISIVSL